MTHQEIVSFLMKKGFNREIGNEKLKQTITTGEKRRFWKKDNISIVINAGEKIIILTTENDRQVINFEDILIIENELYYAVYRKIEF